MDFSPRVQRLIAQIEAVQLKADCSVAQLAAEVRQILLAVTVDIEQRWQFLTPEDRVDAITDIITVTKIYNRTLADAIQIAELLDVLVNKHLTDTASVADMKALQIASVIDDTCTSNDVFACILDYVQSPEDSVGSVDAIQTLLVMMLSYADIASATDLLAVDSDKPLEDLYSPSDALQYEVGKELSDLTAIGDLIATAMGYARDYSDTIPLAESVTTEATLVKADIATSSDTASFGFEAVYADTAQLAEAAALAFATQVQDLVAAAENFARTVNFARTYTDSAPVTDAPAKTFTTAFSDVGGLYAVSGYFADDYVEAGTGLSVYDTFSYTLA